VPSERVDKNSGTGLSYEAPFKPPTLLSEALKKRKAKREGGRITADPLHRLGFTGGGLAIDPLHRLGFTGGGGLMVSIGVAPVSEKQMSKFEKALKKRKAKRDGGRIGFQEGTSVMEEITVTARMPSLQRRLKERAPRYGQQRPASWERYPTLRSDWKPIDPGKFAEWGGANMPITDEQYEEWGKQGYSYDDIQESLKDIAIANEKAWDEFVKTSVLDEATGQRYSQEEWKKMQGLGKGKERRLSKKVIKAGKKAATEKRDKEASGGEIRQRYAFGDRIRKALQRRGEGEITNIEGFKEPRLPSNMRQFVYDLAGGDKTFTEKDLQQDELKAMKELVSKNLKNNKYEISYDDYGTAPDPKGLSDVGGKNIKNVGNTGFISRLRDPRYSMKTTIGAANITVDENEDVFVIDQYNFNDNPLNPATPQEDSSFIRDALRRRGNVYGQLRNVGKHFGSPEGEGSPIVLNLGKMQDLP